MIELNHVTKRYGSFAALRDVSLSIRDGQVVGLLGQNGAGKTTALNLMTGYFPPTEGTVTVNGIDMLRRPRECKRSIGYLPEKPPLYDEMTVAEYLAFVCRLREVRGRAIRGHVADLAGRCGLSEVFHQCIGSLSKGYRQRVGFAEALCGDPPVLILDEPTVGLDPRQTVEIRELIRELGRDHTVVFSSHILSEVQQLCSRVIILHHGRVVHEAATAAEDNGGSVTLEAEILGDASRLLPALRTLQGVRKARGLPDRDGVARIRLVCDAGEGGYEPESRLFRLLSAMDCPLCSLQRSGGSLEEVFLRVTAGEDETEGTR